MLFALAETATSLHVCVLGHVDPWDLQGCVLGRSCLTSFAALLPFGKHKCYSKPLLFQNMCSVITVSMSGAVERGASGMVSLTREQQPSSTKSLGGPKPPHSSQTWGAAALVRLVMVSHTAMSCNP